MDRYDVARLTIKSGLLAAKGCRNQELTLVFQQREKEIEVIERIYGRIKSAMTTLDADPTDKEANEMIGRFYCFTKEDWEKGTPFLALGSNEELARLAALDLKPPASLEDQATLADEWWDLAEKTKDSAKQLRRHAIDRYLAILPRMEGLARRKIENRIQSSEQWLSKDARYMGFPTFDGLPSLLDESEKYHDSKGDEFAFQIGACDAYIVIDLKRECYISRVEIQNRAVHDRMHNATMSFSNTYGERGEKVWTAPDNAKEWSISPAKLHKARYITIALNSTTDCYLHLKKVKVFGPQ